MAQQSTTAVTFDQFIAAQPAERQDSMRQVWQQVRAAMPAGYIEHIGPKYLEFRAGALMYVGLTNQKNYASLHLVPMYLIPAMQELMAAAAPTLKMGKGCVNFNRAEELPVAALAEIIGATSPAEYLAKLKKSKAK
ncbi:MAG: DUF1801 domain-containing protein [Bacteroidota bacterium]|nr:DUF1801 domain-containing protein [Bacteroidota bacterium]